MNTADNPLRILTIGCGGILEGHLQAFEAYPERFRLVGACDPSVAARRAVVDRMRRFGEVEAFADHEKALAELGGKIDAALVVTPHFLHFPQSTACVEAGIPVLVEKPACNTYAEAKKLDELAKKKEVTVMVGQTRRYHRWAKQLRDWISESPDNFGELSSFSLESWQNILCWIATKPDRNADFWILDKDRAGGGVVVSLSCHGLDLLRYLSGSDYDEVSAYGMFDPPFKNGAESACSATLRMKNGAVGTLNANYLARRIPYSESFKLFGTRGSVIQHSSKWGAYEGEVRYGTTTDDNPPGWEFQYDGLHPIPGEDVPGYEDSLFTNQLKEFHQCLVEKREPLTSIRDNLNTMAVIDAIYESMKRGGQPVKVKD